jgi:hypothetical protein
MRRAAATVACAVAVLAAASPAARAATAEDAIATLNAQRAANGLPDGIVEEPTLTAGCAAHDHYMAVNHQLTHFEQPGNAGYSEGGAFAGRNAVLSEGATWTDGNPYENAPLHLDQLLAPRLRALGSADAEGYSCTTTFPGWTAPDPASVTTYTYPGNGSTIYPAEVARELPWTPGQLVGIAPSTRTGPYLIVLVDAPDQSPYANPASLSGATLTGPRGSVAIRTVDGITPVAGSGTLARYMYPGGFIIPTSPLAAGATYRVHVVVTFGGVQSGHDWSFKTLGSDPHSLLVAKRGRLRFSSRSPQPIVVTFTRSGGRHAPSVTIRPGMSIRLRLSPGSWQACGHQAGSKRFAGYDGCVTIIVTGIPKLRLGPGRASGTSVVFALAYSSVLRGRAATLTVTPLTLRCASQRCSPASGQPSTRTIVLKGDKLSFPLPASHHGLRVALSTSAFQLRDAPWTAARATSSFLAR